MHVHASTSAHRHRDPTAMTSFTKQTSRKKVLQYNSKTNEPFLQLRIPGMNIILTPTRFEDVPSMVKYLNDPRVFEGLSSPPNPYLPEHGVSWVKRVVESYGKLLEQTKLAETDDTIMVDGCPVGVIREVKEDGTDEFIGNIDFHRHGWMQIKDEEKRKELSQAENGKSVGDPTICWELGDWLAPQYHGRGIMTAVVQAMIFDWGVSWMNLRHVRCTAWKENIASVKVFEKNGFKLIETSEDCIMVRGRLRSLHVMELWL